MEIGDIIKTEEDRLFIVDPECYIIYTGTSIDDDKPFIRIGNWIDMPVNLIPLVENIIIPDTMTGNPSGEQFNIDIRYLQSNRYIGSREVVRRYLEFQRIFGLDLTNASIVDIEKDIPELSREQNLSSKSQFIGVFYRDGNFKTVHDSSVIIDLKEMNRRFMNFNDLHDLVAEKNRGLSRFNGAGLVIAGHTPLFFSGGFITTYLFPSRYLGVFSRLGIDPSMIRLILQPSMTLLNVMRFLKWKHTSRGPLTIASDHAVLFRNIRRLFPGTSIGQTAFSGLNVKTDGGATISNYPDSYNIKISYAGTGPGDSDIDIAFVKGPGGIKKILADGVDAILVTYSVFEDTPMLFRTSKIPCAVIDDGNKNIRKLAASDMIILKPGIHYEIRAHRDLSTIYSELRIPQDCIPQGDFDAPWLEGLARYAEEQGGDGASPILYNIATILSLALSLTRNRNLSTRCREILQAVRLRINQSMVFSNGQRLRCHLIFFAGGLFTGITEEAFTASDPVFDEVREEERSIFAGTSMGRYIERIFTDRERLKNLLAIYTESERYAGELGSSIRQLERDIHIRKSVSTSEDIVDEAEYRRVMFRGRDASALQETEASGDYESSSVVSGSAPGTVGQPARAGGSVSDTGDTHDDAAAMKTRSPAFSRSLRILLPLLLLLVAAVIVTLFFYGPTSRERHHAPDVLERKLSVTESRYYEKKYNIFIKDGDIFRYANRVAQMNGYNRIPYQTMKTGKNPDWIYPKNTFRMTDGEIVVVKSGDTLWDLSRDKLVRLSVRFEDLLSKGRGLSGAERQRVLKQALEAAFNDSQRDAVNALLEKYGQDHEKGRE
ncbi:MAG: hypothetical protein JXA20_06060 [Spirochaetes bacterium]|nr:hypothetical protein [Spirochaetota bacterium]